MPKSVSLFADSRIIQSWSTHRHMAFACLTKVQSRTNIVNPHMYNNLEREIDVSIIWCPEFGYKIISLLYKCSIHFHNSEHE